MNATRVRFGALLEWLLAVAFIAGAFGVGSFLVREIRSVRAVMPVIAGESLPHEMPAGVPARAVSVPMLLLRNGLEVRLGDRASAVAARFGAAVEVVSESIDRTAVRERLTRIYNTLGTRFIVVFEKEDGEAEPQVAAIYLP